MIEQLALVIIGIVIGSVLGTEYASWRTMRRIKGLFYEFLGTNKQTWDLCSEEQKREFVRAKIEKVMTYLPETSIPRPPPSRIVGLSGNEFFVPTCPQCGYAATPVKTHHQPGVMVKGFCPKHGVFSVLIPETPEKEKKEE